MEGLARPRGGRATVGSDSIRIVAIAAEGVRWMVSPDFGPSSKVFAISRHRQGQTLLELPKAWTQLGIDHVQGGLEHGL